MNVFRNKSLLTALAIVFFTAGCVVGAYMTSFLNPDVTPLFPKDNRSRIDGTAYTNPLLECSELPESISIGQRVNLEEVIEGHIEKAQRDGVLTNAAVYFRDLNNGPWFGVNEDFKFYPASLLKVPIVIAFYSLVDEDSSLLSTQVEYIESDKAVEGSQAFGSSVRLEKGKIYSAMELLEFMLQESSNEATLMLVDIIGAEHILKVYKDLGITPPASGEDYKIDVHTYASFFRILFNATYIDRVASEWILGTMTRSTFTEGIVAGIPSDIPVAHKFGTRENAASGIRQLHDCGIIYVPNNPYILCAMTQGADYTKLAGFIKEISALVYGEVRQ